MPRNSHSSPSIDCQPATRPSISGARYGKHRSRDRILGWKRESWKGSRSIGESRIVASQPHERRFSPGVEIVPPLSYDILPRVTGPESSKMFTTIEMALANSATSASARVYRPSLCPWPTWPLLSSRQRQRAAVNAEMRGSDSSVHHGPAIRMQHLARHIAGIVTSQEQEGWRHFVGLARPAHRSVLTERLQFLGGGATHRVERRPDRPRGHRIHTDAFADEVLREARARRRRGRCRCPHR